MTRRTRYILLVLPLWFFTCTPRAVEEKPCMPNLVDLWGDARVGDWARYRVRDDEGERALLIRIVATAINRVAYETLDPESERLESAEEVILHPEPNLRARYLARVRDCTRERLEIGERVFETVRITRTLPTGTEISWYADEVTAGKLVRQQKGRTELILETYGRGPETSQP